MKRHHLVCDTCAHVVYLARTADGRLVHVTSGRIPGSDPRIPRGVVHEPHWQTP
jgi:hypothetical protein